MIQRRPQGKTLALVMGSIKGLHRTPFEEVIAKAPKQVKRVKGPNATEGVSLVDTVRCVPVFELDRIVSLVPDRQQPVRFVETGVVGIEGNVNSPRHVRGQEEIEFREDIGE